MKKLFLLMAGLLTAISCTACTGDDTNAGISLPDAPSDGTARYFSGKKALVAFFSWGGTTRRMAQEIQRATGGDLYEIEPVTPYPTSYTPCTEVALQERDSNARPAIKGDVNGWEDYDVVYIGCPVWWHTTPMIIHTFCESHDFKGKTVVPFCTYASTYRDETLAEIVSSTPDADHLTGQGLTSGRITAQAIQSWTDLINEEWNNKHAGSSDTGIGNPSSTGSNRMQAQVYRLDGTQATAPGSGHGIRIVKQGNETRKIIR